MRTVILIAYTLIIALLGCSYLSSNDTAQDRVVTELDAREMVNMAIQAALNRDFKALCALSASQTMCESMQRSGYEELTPEKEPKKSCIYEI